MTGFINGLPDLVQAGITILAILFVIAPIGIWRNTEKIGQQNDRIIQLLFDIKQGRKD